MFTPTQNKMLEVLADGSIHSAQELHKCLPDELGNPNNIHAHLTGIRKILRPKGEDIICRLLERKLYYQHVRLLSSPYKD